MSDYTMNESVMASIFESWQSAVMAFLTGRIGGLSELVQKGMESLLVLVFDSEVRDFMASCAGLRDERGRQRVVRNGHQRERDVTTPVGPVHVQAPRVHDRCGEGDGRIKFVSRLLPLWLRRSTDLNELLPALYLKGVSTGDVGPVLEAILGPEASRISASTICRLKCDWQKAFEEFMARSLAGKRYAYWWADGVYFSVRDEADKRCFLVLIGIAEDGSKELVGLWEGFVESKESWREFFIHLKSHGLEGGPKLVVGDGSGGLWQALAEVFPEAKGQRCWVHKMRNLLNALPKSRKKAALAILQEIKRAATKEESDRGFRQFADTFSDKYRKVVDALFADKEALQTYFGFPAAHWLNLQTTNPIESLFATVRLRTRKTRGMMTGQTMGALFFMLCRSASKSWRRIPHAGLLAHVMRGEAFIDGELPRTAAEVYQWGQAA